MGYNPDPNGAWSPPTNPKPGSSPTPTYAAPKPDPSNQTAWRPPPAPGLAGVLQPSPFQTQPAQLSHPLQMPQAPQMVGWGGAPIQPPPFQVQPGVGQINQSQFFDGGQNAAPPQAPAMQSVGSFQQHNPTQGNQFINTISQGAAPGPPPAPGVQAPQMQDPVKRTPEYGMMAGGWGWDGSGPGSQFQSSRNGGQSWTQSGPGQDTATANPNRWNQADNGVAPGTWTRK